MTSRFTELPNNGWKLTNELGYILQDRALGVLQAREIVEASDCLCPTKTVTCLRVPCNLLSSRCQFVTLPLFDAATRSPFKISAGTLVESIIVLKRQGACLDDCLQFMLGTICGNDCDTECDPQRWVSESCPISGAQLNKCGVIKVDVTKKCKDCPLFLCRTGQCPGQCGPKFVSQDAPCDDGTGSAQAQPLRNNSGDCGRDCPRDEYGCPCTVDNNGCCTFCGPCDFAAGELQNCLIGITLLEGDLAQDDILIAVESWRQACTDSCADEDIDQCAGVPTFGFGPQGGF